MTVNTSFQPQSNRPRQGTLSTTSKYITYTSSASIIISSIPEFTAINLGPARILINSPELQASREKSWDSLSPGPRKYYSAVWARSLEQTHNTISHQVSGKVTTPATGCSAYAGVRLPCSLDELLVGATAHAPSRIYKELLLIENAPPRAYLETVP